MTSLKEESEQDFSAFSEHTITDIIERQWPRNTPSRFYDLPPLKTRRALHDVLSFVLEYNNDRSRLNELDASGFTPLHHVASERRPDCLAFLLTVAADPDIPTKDNSTVMDMFNSTGDFRKRSIREMQGILDFHKLVRRSSPQNFATVSRRANNPHWQYSSTVDLQRPRRFRPFDQRIDLKGTAYWVHFPSTDVSNPSYCDIIY